MHKHYLSLILRNLIVLFIKSLVFLTLSLIPFILCCWLWFMFYNTNNDVYVLTGCFSSVFSILYVIFMYGIYNDHFISYPNPPNPVKVGMFYYPRMFLEIIDLVLDYLLDDGKTKIEVIERVKCFKHEYLVRKAFGWYGNNNSYLEFLKSNKIVL